MKKLLLIFFIFQANLFFAQEITIGEWRDHLPYTDAVSVTEANGVVYCATNSALFTYDKSDFSIERLNLVNGLSDIGLSKVRFNEFNNKIVVTYTNGNIDIIDKGKRITNLPAIKTTSIVGSKKINHIYFQEKLAYLSTGFGIVVLNTDKVEIVESYFFGPLGGDIFTNSVTISGGNIYAATNQGVFVADKNSANLIDFNAWSLLPDLGIQRYNSVVSFSNQLFASLDLPGDESDTLYYNSGGVWQKFILDGLDIKELDVTNNVLSVRKKSSVSLYDLALSNIKNIVSNSQVFILPNGVYVDAKGLIWIADNYSGLIKSRSNSSNEFIAPNGPLSATAFNMDFVDGELWKVSGGYNNSSFEAVFNSSNLISYLANDRWERVSGEIKDVNGGRAADAVNVVVNPSNTNQVFMGTWNNGLYEFNNGEVTNLYVAQNSPLDSTSFGSTKINSMTFDKDNVLWVAGSGKQLNSFAQNEWHTFPFPNTSGASNSIVVDNDNNKWIGMQNKNSIVVYNEKGTFDDVSDDEVKILTSGSNDIPGAVLFTLAVDKDGEIWVGTDEGVAVFYNSSNVFDEDIKAEQIFVEQDGQTQILLESEAVTAITVDGANRKWIGTQNSGVFLMSEDGTQQVEHFTKENSPLFSNVIFDIVINSETGEVYIGTEKGLISYKGTATEGGENYDNVYVYPNPVKPDFTGNIAIRGLLKDTDVRITDISGNIVYQTTSFGGQAVWDGKDFNGNKVQTGVYMLFNGSANGDQKAAAKILIYH